MLVSIVIPTYNEVSTIEKTLSCVSEFTLGLHEYEIIIIDGNSTDGTRELLEKIARGNSRITVLENEKRRTPFALNLAIRRAKGEMILRLDAHSEYPQDYFTRCVEGLKNAKADNIGGMVYTRWDGRTVGAKIVAALTSHKFGVGYSSFRTNMVAGPADTVPYGCFSRSVFEEIGLFDERLHRNQDYEFNRRMIAAGKTIWFDPAIQVNYGNKDSLRGLFHQAFTTSRWNPWMWFIAPYSFELRHAIPGLAVLGGALLLLLWLISNNAFIILAALGAIYTAIAVYAAVQQARKFGWWIGIILPPLFFVYHLSYGFGILYGVIRLLLGNAPVQKVREPWPGAGQFRPWPKQNTQGGKKQ